MKILFSPSEAKFQEGKGLPINNKSFIFPEGFNKRIEILKRYQSYIDTASNDKLAKLFGTKKEALIEYYKGDIFKKPTRKVIERYDGVAFDYLMYNKLDSNAQAYIDHNVIVFSNLFGPIRAGDKGIPDYKLKQGEKIEGFAVEKFYQEHFTPYLDDYLKEHPILDLRAGFYEKFYKPAKPYATLKFIKNGKVVSHFSKAYRGVILKEMALHAITSIESLINHTIENITLYDITEHKHKKEIIYHILE